MSYLPWLAGGAAAAYALGRRAADPLNAFMEDYHKVTRLNPMWPETRYWQGKDLPIVITEVEPNRHHNRIILQNILSPEARGKGGPTAVLSYLTTLADKHGVAIALAAIPVGVGGGTGRKPLTQKQLIKWYKRHGFELRNPGEPLDADLLIRHPQLEGRGRGMGAEWTPMRRKPPPPPRKGFVHHKAAAGVSEHRWFPGGEGKTVCTSAVLAAFGIDACGYHYSGYLEQRLNILRKFGWSARSRNSKLRKNESVGAARKLIAQHKWGDPPGTRYMIRVEGHALLLDYDGNTIVDTAPRKRDRRKVLDIRAVFRNPRR